MAANDQGLTEAEARRAMGVIVAANTKVAIDGLKYAQEDHERRTPKEIFTPRQGTKRIVSKVTRRPKTVGVDVRGTKLAKKRAK
jgi:hypothetical protein